jgi:spore germination protein YaaH
MNKLCSDYVTRTYVINTLYTNIIKNGMDMICIDFETIDDTEGFYRFIIEMVPRFKEAGIKVFVKYASGMNKERIVQVVDYVIE